MREIKFRQPLWDKHNKFMRWHYWGFIDGSFVGPEFAPASSMQEAKEQSQQYTGLKDKDGREIYEGDILDDESCRLRIVVFAYGAFKVMWNNKNPTQINLYPFNERWKVIGNIHENPELLSKENRL